MLNPTISILRTPKRRPTGEQRQNVAAVARTDKSVLWFLPRKILEVEVLKETPSRRNTMHHGTIVTGTVIDRDPTRFLPENLHNLMTYVIYRNMYVVSAAIR